MLGNPFRSPHISFSTSAHKVRAQFRAELALRKIFHRLKSHGHVQASPGFCSHCGLSDLDPGP